MTAQQKAFFLLEKHGTYAVGQNDILKPGPGELLVEIHSTSLNPVDWKIKIHDIFVEGYPAVLGTDSAGIVKEVGEGVTEFAVGDRVLHQGYFDNRHATFQQYTLVPAEITAKIPENMTFDQASTIPLVLATAACGLYNDKISLNGGAALTAPWLEGGRNKYAGRSIVIIGGASSVGQMVLQVARLSGFSPIIATASACHEAYLKSLGATHVLPRETVPLSSLASELQKMVSEPIRLVYDSISEPETQNAAYDVLAPGGQLILVLPPLISAAKLTDDKEIIYVFGNVHHPAQRAVGVALYKNMTELLRTGEIKPNNIEVIPGGLNGIFCALEKLEAGVSALKLVAHPQETP
ncbi:hypothetical protein EIP86_000871 [Pleurotus ostreatoroseus]|nr:hypothetical protein EIP86_000871 [Pleurotus ostreatoroseus]